MGKRPLGDMSALDVSKASAAEAVPFAAPAPAAQPVGEAKSLTVKLQASLYARLRAHVFAQEQATGQRVTHQDVMVAALIAWLDRQG